MNPAYVVITPVRDEEAYIEITIRSMLAQTVVPHTWVIVNDGSRDRTGVVIESYASRYSWIRVVHRANRGHRQPGSGVIQAFLEGFTTVAATEWEYVVKLDGDLEFAPDYFAQCFLRFNEDHTLGLAGGRVCSRMAGQLYDDGISDPVFHVRGATKIYRRACWDAIGGVVPYVGWDTIDEMKANMLGWHTQTIRDITMIQLKGTGSADGKWHNWFKNGIANYNTGYHPLFMLLKCIKRILYRPVLLSSVALFCGYFHRWLRCAPHVTDSTVIAYVRQQQIRRIIGRSSIYKS